MVTKREKREQKSSGKAIRDAERAKGWKINLMPYKQELTVFHEDGNIKMSGTEPLTEESDFDVKESLASLCFRAELQNDPDAMFKAKALADKIRGAGKSVVLDTNEMEHICKAYKLMKGLPERFVEFMERIRDAEEISLKEDTEVPS